MKVAFRHPLPVENGPWWLKDRKQKGDRIMLVQTTPKQRNRQANRRSCRVKTQKHFGITILLLLSLLVIWGCGNSPDLIAPDEEWSNSHSSLQTQTGEVAASPIGINSDRYDPDDDDNFNEHEVSAAEEVEPSLLKGQEVGSEIEITVLPGQELGQEQEVMAAPGKLKDKDLVWDAEIDGE